MRIRLSNVAAVTALATILPSHAGAISLQECLALARRNAPVTQVSGADSVRAEQAVREARAALSPTLRLGASLVQLNEAPKTVFDIPAAPGRSTQAIKIASATALNVKTEAQYTLYSGGRDAALVRAAEADARAQASTRLQTDADLVLRVSRAYYLELAAGRLRAAAEEALHAAQSHLSVAEARLRVGVVPKLDVLRAQVDVSQRQIAVVRASEARRLARVELESAIGAPIGAATTLDEPAAPGGAAPDSAQAVAAAVAARPEIAALQRDIDATGERIAAARAAHHPLVTLDALAEYKGPNLHEDYFDFSTAGLKTYDLSAGVRMNMPLLDGGAIDARVGELMAQHTGLEARRRDAVLAVQHQVEQALSDLRVAVAVWDANESRLSSAREALRLADTAYKDGTATATDVRDAETALADSRAEEAQSLMDYWSARAELDHATGATSAQEEK